MSIIQTIREKGARITVVIIAIALVGFILTDYFQSRSRGGGGGSSNTIGSVNGTSIKAEDFNRKVDQEQESMKQQGYPSSPATTQMAIDKIWDQEVGLIISEAEFDKLGLEVSKKELGDILYGPNAPADLKSQFTDSATGQYNAIQAKQQIDQILKKGSAEQKAAFNNYINQLILMRQSEKFMSLISNSYNVPRWFVEKKNADESQMARISMVKEVYSSIPDSTIKIEDKEIADYISKHKDDYKQTESRSISYVSFSAAPSKADTAATKEKVALLTEAFKNESDVKTFLEREGSDIAYTGNFVRAADMRQENKDTLLKIPVGGVYGPYLDNTQFVTAKMIESRMTPDSVTVRHILVKTADQNPQTGVFTQTRDTAEARAFINDSVIALINRGIPFDSVCRKYSDDGGSKDSGGVYKNIKWGTMVPGFNDFIFTNTPGSKGVVYTEFGFHYIEVLKHFGMANSRVVKLAFLSREIGTSPETENNASNQANLFAGDSRDIKSFDANYEKNLKSKGFNKGLASVSPNDGQIMGIGFSRNFVRSIFGAKQGQVLKPEKVDNNYVVAVVTEVLKEGTMSVAKARPSVEAALRNKKKAAILKQKAGTITTLEAAAAAWGGKQIETIDSLRMTGAVNNALGYEPKVIGAAFNPANKGKVVAEALEGQNGVYVLRVDNVSATSVIAGSIAEQRKTQADQKKNTFNPLDALKKMATIKDKRTERY